MRTAVSFFSPKFCFSVSLLFHLPKKIIGTVFRKSLRLSGRGRVDHSVGKITTIISTDASRLDRFSGYAHRYVVLLSAPLKVSYLNLIVYGLRQYRFVIYRLKFESLMAH